MSIDLHVDLHGLDRLADRIARLGDVDTRPLMDELGAEVTSQTRRRIDSEKTDPEGIPWEPWSESYARTRHANQSLLQAMNYLYDSIEYVMGISGDSVEVGSNMIYAAAHQYGLDMSVTSTRRRITIPARPYLGISAENAEDLVALVDDWMDRQLEVLQ